MADEKLPVLSRGRLPQLPSDGVDKAAILLMTLGAEAAASVLRHLSESEVRQLSAAIARLRTIRREQAAAVHEEAWRWLTSKEGFLVDGEGFALKLIETKAKTAGTTAEKEAALRELRQKQEAAGGDSLATSLESVPAPVVAQMLAGEHPQVIAFVLAHLEPRQASEIVAALPEDHHADILFRIADLKSVSDELLAEVSSVLRGQVAGLGSVATGGAALGGTKLAAEILNCADKSLEARVFQYLEEAAPELGEQIRNLMLTFEDLGQLDARGMQTLLKEVPRDDLLLALKTASPDMKDKILGNMSARAREILLDDLSSMGPVRLKDVEKAQTNIVGIARRLADEQKINLGGTGDALV